MSARDVILVTGADLAPQAVAMLHDFDIVYAGKECPEDLLEALCKQHQPVAMVVRYGRISARVIAASERLRVISKHGTGIDNIDSAAAKARGVVVRAAAGANAPAVAEHTWALILACAKGVVPLDARMREGHWDKSTHKSLELKGRTLGLVGLGAIGRMVATTGSALGMRVVAYDPFASSFPAGIESVTLEQLFASADVVSLHCPLTAQNANMINATSLASMRDGAIVVNTARGGLIDEAALADALRSGKLRGAGLDSFQVEPFTPGHAFVGLPNVVLTPHVGGVTADAYIGMGTGAAQNILDELAVTA